MERAAKTSAHNTHCLGYHSVHDNIYPDKLIHHSDVGHASRSSSGLTAGLKIKYNKVKHESISLATGSVRHQLSDPVSVAIADSSEGVNVSFGFTFMIYSQRRIEKAKTKSMSQTDKFQVTSSQCFL